MPHLQNAHAKNGNSPGLLLELLAQTVRDLLVDLSHLLVLGVNHATTVLLLEVVEGCRCVNTLIKVSLFIEEKAMDRRQ